MAKTLFCFFLLLLPAAAYPAWWAENDYSIGSGRFQRESLSVSARISPSIIGGAGASFYKDDDHNNKKSSEGD